MYWDNRTNVKHMTRVNYFASQDFLKKYFDFTIVIRPALKNEFLPRQTDAAFVKQSS